MGMITRVRSRVRANSLMIDKERTAQSVCLLSAVLLLPYCPRGPLPLLPPPAPALYSVLVLPVVLSANYRYPVSALKTLSEAIKAVAKQAWDPTSRILRRLYGPIDRAENHFLKMKNISVMGKTIFFFLGGLRSKNGIQSVAKRAWDPTSRILRRLYGPIDRAENLFLKMKNISVMANQIVFLVLADKVLVPQQRMTCLYTLMFYNVIAYCVSYIKELVEKEDWSPYVTLTERSQIKHLAMSATKIVLEWTKAVTFAVTLTFMLLVFGLEQGLQNYKPSTLYTIVTWTYYSATEKVFVDMFPGILSFMQLESLESLENLYAPVILRSFTIFMSALFNLILVPTAPWKFLLAATYLSVFLRSKELWQNSAVVLRAERQILNRYRKATREEIEKFDDVCAVCLFGMKKARITPCHHLFHADCLRQCLKTSDKCPMCKREFKFD